MANINRRNFLAGAVASFVFSPLVAESAQKASESRSDKIVPEEYGRIVFQKNPNAENQLYIIPNSERHPDTGIFDEHELKVQVSVYRIGEHLIKSRGVKLILEEGLFAEHDYRGLHENYRLKVKRELGNKFKLSPSDSDLEQILIAGTGSIGGDYGIDASDLLGLYHQTINQGAENKNAYNSADRFLRDPSHDFVLQYFNELRSALILINAPNVIAREIQAGRIKTRTAIMPIGNAHLDEMVRFVQDDRASVRDSLGKIAYERPLEYGQKNYGVTVIEPKGLIANVGR